MPFYETIFENGRCSVVECASDEEALEGAKAHHERAKAGLPGGPTGEPAERIVKLLKYDEHPNNFNLADTLPADQLEAEVKSLINELKDKNGIVAVGVLASEVRGLSHPMHRVSGAHDSKFKMPEVAELVIK